MARKAGNISVNKSQNATYVIDKDAKTYVMGPKFVSSGAATLTGIDTATSVGSTKVTFNGKINLPGADGSKVYVGMDIDVSGTSSITIGARGMVSAANVGIDARMDGGELSIVNKGRIVSSVGTGVLAVNDLGAEGTLSITNNKSISGATYGILMVDDGGAIVNNAKATISGTGAGGVGIQFSAGSSFDELIYGDVVSTINNKGTISGAAGAMAISAVDGIAVALTNSGTVNGDIRFANGNDRIINNGTITGLIDMGAGDDTVIANKAINGAITLGDGNDRFVGQVAAGLTISGGKGDDIYVFLDEVGTIDEKIDQGIDTVVGRISIDLSSASFKNIENAALAGKADIDAKGSDGANKLIGNAGANRIDGGGGDDELSGGDGADIFVFTKDSNGTSGADTINDFKNGVDRVDVSALGIKQLTDFSLVPDGQSGTIAIAGLSSIYFKGIVISELDATDFIFAP